MAAVNDEDDIWSLWTSYRVIHFPSLYSNCEYFDL